MLVCHENWESSSKGCVSFMSSLVGMASPLSALFLWKGPTLVPVLGTGQGNIPLDMELPTVGCWCWCCSWHHRGSSPKGIACLEIAPWLSVTRPWDISHSPRSSVQMQTQHPSTFKWLQGTYSFIFSPSPLLHFGSLLLPEGGAHEVLGGRVWLSEVGYS